MSAKKLTGHTIGMQKIDESILEKASLSSANLFDLSSHSTVLKSLEFALNLRQEGFHVFIVGEERTERTAATISALHHLTKECPVPNDWVYLCNFKAPQNPLAFSFPPGIGQKLKGFLSAMITHMHKNLWNKINSPDFSSKLHKLTYEANQKITSEMRKLKEKAFKSGFSIEKDNDETLFIKKLENDNTTSANEIFFHLDKKDQKTFIKLRDDLNSIILESQTTMSLLEDQSFQLKLDLAKSTFSPYFDNLLAKFHTPGFHKWVQSFQHDVLKNIDEFSKPSETSIPEYLAQRYAVNLFVDHSSHAHMPILKLSHPSYENLFGSIKHHITTDGIETDHTLIQPGILHKANGGILVLQADALAQQPDVWPFIKRAIRDKEIRIEELYRQNGAPLLMAPSPQTIPLEIQIVIVGAPWWYYDFFSVDPEFRSYFKIRAEIDMTISASKENIKNYVSLIQEWSENSLNCQCDVSALQALLGHSSRWAGHQKKLSARFELVKDMIKEAKVFAKNRKSNVISKCDIDDVFIMRRARKSRPQTRHLDDILSDRIRIETQGTAIGQINALTVSNAGDIFYGSPARITARTYAAKEGVVSIERSISMSGSIQDKGVMVLMAFLNATFGQDAAISFGCSITFEQTYVPIDGDSASLAELLSVLSSLGEIPIRQDIAITGSIDQMGRIQSVGGLHQKIEGFYELCKARGFTGTQGVILPEDNVMDLVMWDDLVHSVEIGEFHIWSVREINDVTPLIFGIPWENKESTQSGFLLENQHIETVLDRVKKKLVHFNHVLDKQKS